MTDQPPHLRLVRSGGRVSAAQARRRIVKRGRSEPAASGLVIRTADLSRTRPFRWAWDQRVLLGYFNLIIGEEGIGKGNLAAWIAARITRGELPGDLLGRGRRVAFIGDEDSWDHIWTPRLHAAGADLGRISYIEAGSNGALNVRSDADALRDYIKRGRIALVFFDQLLDNLGVADSWKDKEVRDVLAPLRTVARATEAAMLASMHPNKRGGSFRDRISGTPAFNALSRSSLLAMPHPDEQGRCVVVRGKGNYSMEPDAFEFRIAGQTLNVSDREIRTSRITDVRETELRRDDLLMNGGRRRDDESKAGQARAMLADMFADGREREATEVIQFFEGTHGIQKRTLSAAARDIGLKIEKRDFPAVVYWRRPDRP